MLVVLPPRALLLDLAGPLEALRVAGATQDRVGFDIAYAAPEATTRSSVGLDLSGARPLPGAVEDGAVVLLPGSSGYALGPPRDGEADRRAEAAIVAWLRRAVRPGHTLVTVCEGALLAARAGLLDGYACTTHHASCAKLAAAAPRARVLENRLFVEDRDRFSSAGVTAGVDLMLCLVALWVGRRRPSPRPAPWWSTCAAARTTRSSRRGWKGVTTSTRRCTARRTPSPPTRRATGPSPSWAGPRAPARATCRGCSRRTPA